MRKLFLIVGIIICLQATCTIGAGQGPDPKDVNAANTQVEQTVAAQLTRDQSAIETIVAATSGVINQAPPPLTQDEPPLPPLEPSATQSATEAHTETATSTIELTATLAASDPKKDLGAPSWTDNFNSGNNWPSFDEPPSKVEVSGGKLLYTIKQASSGTQWIVALQSLDNVYIEVFAKTPAVCSGKDRYGMLLRAPDNNRGMIFEFSCDGAFRISTWDTVTWKELNSWTTSANINVGPDQINRMGIKAVGNTFQLYANGVLLREVTDNTYGAGRFGLVAGSDTTANLLIEFDDMAYWVLP